MTSIATKIGKKMASNHARQYEPEDPMYEFYDSGNGKQKRRKRAPPPGLTKQEAKLLKKIARRAHYLDKGFYICGIRFGWTALIGIIPGVGDAADALLNYTLVYRPSKKGADLPPDICRKMMFNNAVSAGVGLVPIAGDIALAVWKANSRNAHLLEKFLAARGEEHIAAGMTGLTPRVGHSTPATGSVAERNHPGASSVAGSSTLVNNETHVTKTGTVMEGGKKSWFGSKSKGSTAA